MYLKALRLRGFKSFPQRVELAFEPGIAVIVGPNGSGKSNIADALQWAMAAPSPTQLRAPTGQDMLFAGSAGRPPAGVCEVELVFDNETGAAAALPIEFGEVSVLRRLFRDGDGEYRINRARVRRLDVNELLAGTGLGRESHAIIGQGRVEEILLSRPPDRRRFVEEAAGLGRYQRRRARAEAKLARVEADLQRARDLEREVAARLRPLAVQATAAERAARLGEEVGAGRRRLLASQLAAETSRADGLRGDLGAAVARRDAVDAEMAATLAAREAAEARLAGLAAAHETAARARYALEAARGRVGMSRERLAQAIAVLARAAARHRADAERLDDGAVRQEAEAGDAERAAAALREEADGVDRGDEGAAAEAAARAEAALAAAAEARRALAEAEGAVATARRGAAESAARAQALAGRVEGCASRSADARTRLAAARAGAAEHETAAAAAAAALSGAEREARTLAESARAADEAAAAARVRADELDGMCDVTRARLAALGAALERGEGLPPAARRLAEAGATLVVAGIEAAPGYERAVAAALGWRAGAVVAADRAEALSLLGAVDDELGVVTAAGDRPEPGRLPAPGARPLAEVVTVRDRTLAALVDGVWLVDDLSTVSAGRAVTAAGEAYDADRGEGWRVAGSGEAGWLAARAEHERAAASLSGLEAARGEAAAAREAGERAAAAAGAAARAADGALAAARSAEADAAGRLRTAVAAGERLEDELTRLDAAAEAAAGELARERAHGEELARALAGHEAALAGRRDAATEADTRHAALDRLRREAAERAARAGARVAALRERAERFDAEALRAAAAGEAARRRAAAARAGAAAAADGADPAAAALAALDAAARVAAALEEPARGRLAALERQAGELAASLRECAAHEAALQGRAREAMAAVAEVEVGIARCEDHAAELHRRAAEIDPAAPELAAEPMAADEAAALAARLERLERRRASLGAVNPLAREEYEAERARAGDLTAQCDDLERSLVELRGLVRDLTATIDARFDETFGTVARNFAEVVEALFPGGAGRLRLTEPPPPGDAGQGDGDAEEALARPEPGIELEVRPAGKRITSLSLLSGGEKALAAIAFLFSLFLTRPSPFYVLDEVEAALDDANIDRFLTLLRRYRDRAQFIVITHQRRTMEVADTLYGVSMPGDGESRVLARRMPPASRDADPVAASSA